MVLEVQNIDLKSNFKMEKLSPLQKLIFSRNFSEHREKWKQKYTLYHCHGKNEKIKEIKSKILLRSIGPRGSKLYIFFPFDDKSQKMNVSALLEQFDDCCSPQKKRGGQKSYFWTFKNIFKYHRCWQISRYRKLQNSQHSNSHPEVMIRC